MRTPPRLFSDGVSHATVVVPSKASLFLSRERLSFGMGLGSCAACHQTPLRRCSPGHSGFPVLIKVKPPTAFDRKPAAGLAPTLCSSSHKKAIDRRKQPLICAEKDGHHEKLVSNNTRQRRRRKYGANTIFFSQRTHGGCH